MKKSEIIKILSDFKDDFEISDPNINDYLESLKKLFENSKEEKIKSITSRIKLSHEKINEIKFANEIVKDQEEILDGAKRVLSNVKNSLKRIAFTYDEVLRFKDSIFLSEEDFHYCAVGYFVDGKIVKPSKYGKIEILNGKLGTTREEDFGGNNMWGAFIDFPENSYFFPYGIDPEVKESELILWLKNKIFTKD